MNRRDCLKLLATALTAPLLRPRGLQGAAPVGPAASGDQLDRIGLQLYTVRQAMAQDFEGTLARVAQIGYREVEFAGYFARDAGTVRGALDTAGLDAPAAHIPLENLRTRWAQTLDDARVIGHRYLVVPSLPAEDSRTLDGYRAVADLFNRAGEQARGAGIRLGFHNHAGEFAPLSGRVPYDVLLEDTDPQLVWFEMDLYWIRRGGGDPLSLFARHPGRFALVHVKDMDDTPQQGIVDVGAGVIDFKRIFTRREQAGIRHFFVEHDNPASPFDSIRVSFDYLRQLEF